RRTPLGEIEDRWLVKKQEVDAGLRQAAKQVTGGLTTVRQAAGRFFEYLDHRAKTGTPEPLSDWTRADYVRVIKHFGRCVGADRPLSGLGPPDFELFAKEYAGQAPSTLGRV